MVIYEPEIYEYTEEELREINELINDKEFIEFVTKKLKWKESETQDER